jgi:hypothetical protein
VSGEDFTFEVAADYEIVVGGSVTYFAVSSDIGSYPVTDNTSIQVNRTDGADIDSNLSFSCFDNSGSLGYEAEDMFAFRQRVLTDPDRQDAIAELELAIRNTTKILECRLFYNQTAGNVVYDGITVGAMELLVTISGAPTSELAELVVGRTPYLTHMVDAANVVYYVADSYSGGKVPVYYTFFQRFNFSLTISYRYDKTLVNTVQIEAAINALLLKYKNMSTFVASLSEQDIYSLLTAVNLQSVVILNVDLLVDGQTQSYLDIPKTRLLSLQNTVYTPVVQSGAT